MRCQNSTIIENEVFYVAMSVTTLCTFVNMYFVIVLIANRCFISSQHEDVARQMKFISNNNNSLQKRKATLKPKESRMSITSSNQVSDEKSYQSLDWLKIAASIFILLRSVSDVVRLVYTKYTGLYCKSILIIQLSLHAFAMISSYSFLWLRQRILYRLPAIRTVTSKYVLTLSWTVLIFMIIGVIGVVMTFIFAFVIEIEPSGNGSNNNHSHYYMPKEVPWCLLGVVTVAIQLMNLTLFIYPLWKQKHALKSSYTIRGSSRRNITLVIHRVIKSAVVCILADITAASVSAGVRVAIVGELAYNISLSLTLIGIVCSFADWKDQLFPMRHFCNLAFKRNFYECKNNVNMHPNRDKTLEISISSIAHIRHLDAVILRPF